MVILVVGAHPDDIEIGLGATVHRFQHEHQFHGLVLTSGSLRAGAEERERATVRSAKILGYTPYFGRLEDGAFTEREAGRLIERKIAELKPSLVIGHSPRERHQDHWTAQIATLLSSRRALMLIFFEGPYTYSFTPQLYVPVDDVDLRAKNEALGEHAKVLEQRRYLEEAYIRALAITRGAVVTTTYAEAFMVDRLISGPFQSLTTLSNIKGETND